MADKPKVLLITGVPGSGKTSIGEFFKTVYGYAHYDMEKSQYPELSSIKTNSIITWGFDPEDLNSLNFLRQITNSGGKMIWLDGNRDASKKAFVDRADVSVQAYEVQINKINKNIESINAEFSPKCINPFEATGLFKSKEKIAKEILE